jgi:hypothetical protein
VWKRDKAKELLVSLIKNYPVGGLLLWKTTSPPALKNLDDLPENFGTLQVLLDGQQRCTTLYMLLTGLIPPYYNENEIENDPRTLAFNLRTREFSYWQNTIMKDDPYWQYVINCMTEEIKPVEIARQKIKDFELLKKAADFSPVQIMKGVIKELFQIFVIKLKRRELKWYFGPDKFGR